jgi:hypothetical protein
LGVALVGVPDQLPRPLGDLADHGVGVDHTTLFRWVQAYASTALRPCTGSWRVDEKCVKVKGVRTYLCSAYSRRGGLALLVEFGHLWLQQLQAIDRPNDLGAGIRGKRCPERRAQLIKSLPPITQKRVVVAHTQGGQTAPMRLTRLTCSATSPLRRGRNFLGIRYSDQI